MSTAPLPPNAPLADIYACIAPGQTIAEGDNQNGPQSFVVLAKERRGRPVERIRVYTLSSTSGFLDIGDYLATPVDRLLNPDLSVLWVRP